jgi:hypothetical protein
MAVDYPCQQVANLALTVATTGLNTFKGLLGKTVVHKESPVVDDVAEMAKRATLMKEVALATPRISGPSLSCPFPDARVCPVTTRDKDPYDPESTRLRLISDFSRRRRGDDGGSVNDLCWSPKLLSYHASASDLRDTLAWLYLCFGAGILAWTADIPSCFRMNHLNGTLLSLFVYKIVTEAFGVEWFVDLATPFGWTPAEWGWQCMLALIIWAFRKKGLGDMICYVDNFFYIMHPKGQGRSTTATFAAIEAVFTLLNIPLHEQMHGDSFKGLGWMWDTSPTDGPPLMVCADDKFTYLCLKLPVWAAATELAFEEVEGIIGFLGWIASGFPIGNPHLGYLRANLGAHVHSARGRSGPKRLQMVQLSKESIMAIAFWAEFFPTWNKQCPVFLGLGPMAEPEVLWRFDASTEWGMGAFMWVVGEPTAVFIMHKWTAKEREHAFVKDRESTGVMEGMAAVRCARAFAKRSRGKRVLMEGDNESLARGLNRGYSSNPKMMKPIITVAGLAAKEGVHLRSMHIKGMHTRRTCTTITYSMHVQVA